ncbi:MAG: methyl-accepting chemotaxis protein [Deinococcus sp.]|uniref:methyl-accepting chemotaxis protein n=1 Tax=Deinococcus sp. TaxID=47478 RepID=UPI0026DC0846|nr:methyl-accepting chemotaxis protein [Deinococcus sp.]MDO4245334.1 methyl-accepting chemotaxis protein [Deinococcus sp.]
MTNTISPGTPAQPLSRPKARKAPFRLGDLSVGQKLALGSVPLLFPFAISLGFNINDQLQELKKDRTAIRSMAYLTPATQLLGDLQASRRPIQLFLDGQTQPGSDLERRQQDIQAAFAQLRQLDRSAPIGSRTAEAINALEQRWNVLSNDVQQKRLTSAQAGNQLHDLLSNEAAALMSTIAVEGQMRHLQYPTTPELASLATSVLPQQWPDAGSLPAQLASAQGVARNGQLPAATLAQYQQAFRAARRAQTTINQVGQAALVTNPRDTANLKAAFGDMQRQTQAFNNSFQQIAAQGRVPSDTRALAQLGQASLAAQTRFYEETLVSLRKAIQYEIDALNTAFILTLIASATLMLVALWLATLIARAITQPLQLLTSASNRLSSGDLDIQLPVTTRDELGTLTRSFNSAATQLRENAERDAREREEARQLQHNIGEFLDVTMDIAEGDLTRRGQVTADVLGNVVDSINLMTEELAQLLQQVQQSSNSVGSGSQQMLGSTRQIEDASRQTSSEAQRVAQQIEQLTDTIRQMAEDAQRSAETARLTLVASQQGQQAVEETLGGMQNIRREVQQVSKRIKSLGDRSLEIQEVVDTISQIARRTNLLALNASVEAAGAGEAGGRFSAVAEEIRQLAVTSAQATTRVATLIRNVQVEVQDVALGAEEGTREVEQGYRIASTAGERLQEIGQLTEQSARFAETVAASTRQQASGVEQVGAAVQQIAGVAEQAQTAAQQGRSAAQQLEALAQQLDQSLARFRLPD